MPTWATVGLLLGLAGLGVFVVSKSFSSTASGLQDVSSLKAAIRGSIERDDYDRAAKLLEQLEAEEDLSAKERTSVASFAEEMRASLDAAYASRRNVEGSRWFDNFLDKYESRYLQNEPSHAKIRTFLRLCTEFKEQFPGHPEMSWVETQEAAWSRYASLEEAPSFEDIAWDIKYTLNRKPRDYRKAFEVLTAYEKTCADGGCGKARDLRAELETERAEYHQDRLQEARYEFEQKDNPSKAVMWLISSVTMLGDAAMEDEAASFYIKMPNFESTMLGMKNDQPKRFEGVLKNKIIRDRARELGVID